jgi:hypothetical protein
MDAHDYLKEDGPRNDHDMDLATFIGRYGGLWPIAAPGQELGDTAVVVLPGGQRVQLKIMDDGSGGAAWVQVNDVASFGLASKYWVNVLGAQPPAAYARIQDAIDAAVADGHGPSAPTAVFVMPGSYTEDLQLAAGVSVVGMGQDSDGTPVTVTGAAVFASAFAQGSLALRGLILQQPAGGTLAPLSLMGADPQTLVLDRCAVHATSGAAILNLNTSGAVVLELHATEVVSIDPGATARAVLASQRLQVTATGGRFAVPLGGICLELFASSAQIQGTAVQGAVSLTTGQLATEGGQLVSGAVAAVTLAGGTAILQKTLVNSSALVTYGGTAGTLTLLDCAHPGNCAKEPAITTGQLRGVRLVTRVQLGGAGPILFPRNVDVLEVDTTGQAADVVVQLQPASNLPLGLLLTVKLVAPLPVPALPILVQITPDGADGIDGGLVGAAYPLAPGPNGFQAVTLRVRGTAGAGAWSVDVPPQYPACLDTTTAPGDVPNTTEVLGRAAIPTGQVQITVNALRCRADSAILLGLQTSDGATPGLFAIPAAGSFLVSNSAGTPTLSDVSFTWELRS